MLLVVYCVVMGQLSVDVNINAWGCRVVLDMQLWSLDVLSYTWAALLYSLGAIVWLLVYGVTWRGNFIR